MRKRETQRDRPRERESMRARARERQRARVHAPKRLNAQETENKIRFLKSKLYSHCAKELLAVDLLLQIFTAC